MALMIECDRMLKNRLPFDILMIYDWFGRSNMHVVYI